MSIQNKDWYAQDDKMPGVNTFRVSGTVTVPNSATQAILVPSTNHGAKNYLILDLKLEENGIGAQVLTERKVTYTQPSGAAINGVTVYHNGVELVVIKDVQITH